jgi:transposase InsO family protein
LDDHRMLGSIGSVGDAYDNALAESFVDSFKTELIADRLAHPHRARARDRRMGRLVEPRSTARSARRPAR